ncbi:MAG: hypothetical protein LBH42_04685 [Treponema sp.]|jgi:hypothetical protein|nr:hypothetical protein [Treponema sp.]
MIVVTQETSLKLPIVPVSAAIRRGPPVEATGLSRLEVLRQKINNEDYLHEAIQRIALIISNELLDLPPGGRPYEQQRKSRTWPRK